MTRRPTPSTTTRTMNTAKTTTAIRKSDSILREQPLDFALTLSIHKTSISLHVSNRSARYAGPAAEVRLAIM